VPLARNRQTSKGCPGVVLRATRGDRNNIPYKLFLKLIKGLLIYSIKIEGPVFLGKAVKGSSNLTIVFNKALVEVIET
jgi:hypothetical protein